MKVLIAGSKQIKSFALIKEAVERSGYKITEVIFPEEETEFNRGVSAWIHQTAPTRAEGYQRKDPALVVTPVKADWGAHGAQSGYTRAADMVKDADAVILILDESASNRVGNSIRECTQRAKKPLFMMELKFEVPAILEKKVTRLEY